MNVLMMSKLAERHSDRLTVAVVPVPAEGGHALSIVKRSGAMVDGAYYPSLVVVGKQVTVPREPTEAWFEFVVGSICDELDDYVAENRVRLAREALTPMEEQT